MDIQQLEAYYHETGEPLWGHLYKEAIAKADKELEELRQKKEKGFTDEEKTDFRNFQKGDLMSLEGRGMSIPVIHESQMGYEGKKVIGTPSDLIDQMKKVRDYRHSEDYLVEPGRQGKLEQSDLEGLESERRIHDEVYGYDRVAQGVALGAFKAGDVGVAAKALAFAEKINKLDSDNIAKMKDLISKLDVKSQKHFAEAYKVEKGA